VTALSGAQAEPLQRVGGRLSEFLAGEIERWGAVEDELRDPLTTLRSALVPGGKRLRPAFCYWAFVGAGGRPEDPRVIDAGAALEMLHAAALLHDDVIDGSDRRHGSATAHVRYANWHRAGAWRGDSGRFGAGVAILLGDLALAYSGRLLGCVPAVARQVFDEARLEVNLGQYLDILGAAQRAVGETDGVARARTICRYKTATYTVERPLHLGAAIAAPDHFAELAGPLSAFGLPLGEAFQLRDDLLGVYGDPAVTGKPVGDDLREGKPTLLAGLACAEATGPDARFLDARLGAPDLSDAEVEEIRRIMEATGARRQVEATIERLAAIAQEALTALPVPLEARQGLGELAAFVTGRDR
jgi:geranylgeranyl diphosphate synthase type I